MCTTERRLSTPSALIGAVSSIRLLVVSPASPPQSSSSRSPYRSSAPHPPGPGLGMQAPSVWIVTTRSSSTWSSLNDDLDPLELLDLGVAGGRHRAAQRADEVHGAVRHPRGPEEDLLERPDRLELHPLAAREVVVVRFGAPVEASAGCVARAGEG